MSEKLLYHFFSDDDFLRISGKIREAELKTSGEIRISIREKKSFRQHRKDIRTLAEEEFFKLGMDKTREKTGILLFLILRERKFYILADEGINAKVDQSTWDVIRDEIQAEFKNGHFAGGLIKGIERVGKILQTHFPIKLDDTDELSNRINIT